MRAVIQRVSRASVDVDNETIGSIEEAFLFFSVLLMKIREKTWRIL